MPTAEDRREALAEMRRLVMEELTTPAPGDQFSATALLVANRARREWEAVATKWREENRRLEAENKELKERVYELEKEKRRRRAAALEPAVQP